ncbi:MAG: M23 family metallopeptidase [Acidobacteria bacterium]|nr:M23 family metallopeptidase [Acidobacteriota bacterium]
MSRRAVYSSIALILFAALSSAALYALRKQPGKQAARPESIAAPTPAPIIIPASDGFDYPIGKSRRSTQANDGDGWYTAQDFGENRHLGEDWNKESGGNTDCGLPIYAASKGTIIFAGEAGPGWGKVVIIRHKLPDGTLVETLYGHLSSLAHASGQTVERREAIGRIGDADGAYLCHLHFELRISDCQFWGLTGPGYSDDSRGWLDPSDFIDARRNLPRD